MKPVVAPLIILAALLACVGAAGAQTASRPLPATQLLDSSKVYTYVAQMPVYPGGRAALVADLRREFHAASAANNCATPAFPVFVRLLVGPSGHVYTVRSLNAEEADRRRSGLPAAKLPELPAACEAALREAARHLPRLKPGRQNHQPVTVELVIQLLGGNK